MVAIDGSIVAEEDGAAEEIAVGTLDGSIVVGVEEGSAEGSLVGNVDGVEESSKEDGSGVSTIETNASMLGDKVGKRVPRSASSAVLVVPGTHPPQ